MKQKLNSLRFRMVLPVIAMTLFVVIMLTVLFTRSYTDRIAQQEQEMNAVGFDTVSHFITPLISSSISEAGASWPTTGSRPTHGFSTPP